MEEKKKFHIDGKKIRDLDSFFRELARQLFPDIPDWNYNFDGLDDMLGGGFGTPENGCVLFWDNHQLSRARLGHEETARVLEKRLKRSHSSARNEIMKQIRMAKRREGPTIFDDIVEIFERHKPIEGNIYTVELRLR
ncbi:barstar family protein [Rhizobium johnstonii]|uniref:barstar family protein n=1 Tax=Rhizobium TaxID=379 RepID=UPI00103753DF|nr:MULTISPECIES: barstar family protein [Rhizobium]MCW1407685.1 barstar family protein [Rhizobium acaciae]MCW1739627.1 barstar family protein [Rhizobium acaciae]MCW1753840.1 barstar family protein [Rhizobium acaciae]TBF89408.1 barnase inhibitor [Rhizobium leguminosarum]